MAKNGVKYPQTPLASLADFFVLFFRQADFSLLFPLMWSLLRGYCHYLSLVSDSAWIRGLDIKICSCRQSLWKSLILIFCSDALILRIRALRSISLLGSRIIFGWGLKKMVGNLGVIGPRLLTSWTKIVLQNQEKIVIQNQERMSEFIQAFIRLDFYYFNCFKDFPKDQKDRRLLFRIPDLSKRLTSRNINRREKRYFRCGNSVKDYLSAGHFCVFFFLGRKPERSFSPWSCFLFRSIQDLDLLSSCCLILGDIFSGLPERNVRITTQNGEGKVLKYKQILSSKSNQSCWQYPVLN